MLLLPCCRYALEERQPVSNLTLGYCHAINSEGKGLLQLSYYRKTRWERLKSVLLFMRVVVGFAMQKSLSLIGLQNKGCTELIF